MRFVACGLLQQVCAAAWRGLVAGNAHTLHPTSSFAGFVSIPHDFSLPDFKAQLQALLAGYGIIVGEEFSLHSAVSGGGERGGDDGGEDSASEGGSGTVSVDDGSPSRELSSSSGSGTFGAGGSACAGATPQHASPNSCGADSPGACSQAEQQDE